jgi:hypothetical protein
MQARGCPVAIDGVSVDVMLPWAVLSYHRSEMPGTRNRSETRRRPWNDVVNAAGTSIRTDASKPSGTSSGNARTNRVKRYPRSSRPRSPFGLHGRSERPSGRDRTAEADLERADWFLPASHAVEEVLHVRVGGIRIIPGRGRPVFGGTCGLLALGHVSRLVCRIVNDRAFRPQQEIVALAVLVVGEH